VYGVFYIARALPGMIFPGSERASTARRATRRAVPYWHVISPEVAAFGVNYIKLTEARHVVSATETTKNVAKIN